MNVRIRKVFFSRAIVLYCKGRSSGLIGRSRTLSDPFVKLSNVDRKPPDIPSDLSETEVHCLSDLSELVFDSTVTSYLVVLPGQHANRPTYLVCQ